jgi:hypothetical protein
MDRIVEGQTVPAVGTVEPIEAMPPNVSATKLRWSAIFGGVFAALGLWVLLASFGLAVGLRSMSPQETSLRGEGMWLGIWSLVMPILALAFGTFIAVRATVVAHRGTGLLYGVVVWGLTTFVATMMVVSMATSAVGGTINLAGRLIGGLGGAAASAVGEAAGGGEQLAQGAADWLNMQREEMLAPINERLAAEGKPPVTPDQLQGAMREAATTAIRQGRLDEQTIVGALERNTTLERADAQELAGQLQEQWDQTAGRVTAQVQEAAEGARNAALTAANRLGSAFWFVFFSILLGLLASLAVGFFVSTWRRAPRAMRPARVAAPARFEEVPTGA